MLHGLTEIKLEKLYWWCLLGNTFILFDEPRFWKKRIASFYFQGQLRQIRHTSFCKICIV